jgi:hypothetical protein
MEMGLRERTALYEIIINAAFVSIRSHEGTSLTTETKSTESVYELSTSEMSPHDCQMFIMHPTVASLLDSSRHVDLQAHLRS